MFVQQPLDWRASASPKADAHELDVALDTFSRLLPCYAWQWRRLVVQAISGKHSRLRSAGRSPPDCDEVFHGLGHLQTIDAQMPGVHEIVDPLRLAAALLMEVGFCLGQLIVMVGEAQILATSVDVHFLSNDAAGHG